jgi:aquaporin related protein
LDLLGWSLCGIGVGSWFLPADEGFGIRMANPGQDGDVENDPTQNPDHEVAQNVEKRQAKVEKIHAIEQEGSSAVPTHSLDKATAAGFKKNGDLNLERKPAPDRRGGERSGENVVGGGAQPDLEAQWPGSAGLS